MATSSTTDFPKFSDLTNFIPKNFDGNRAEVHHFISSCDKAYSLATENQKAMLLSYITTRFTGSAFAQLKDKSFDNWQELKDILFTLFSDKKHFVQLMRELHHLRQGTESIMDFHNKIDNLQTRLLNSLPSNNPDEILGRTSMIRDLALMIFMYQCNSSISACLRNRSPNSLSEALNYATEEERALRLIKPKNHSPSGVPKFCTHCRTNTHNTSNCYKSKRGVNVASSSLNPKPQEKICNYCKNKGHLISECRKRRFNNEKRQAQNIQFSEPKNDQPDVSWDWN